MHGVLSRDPEMAGDGGMDGRRPGRALRAGGAGYGILRGVPTTLGAIGRHPVLRRFAWSEGKPVQCARLARLLHPTTTTTTTTSLRLRLQALRRLHDEAGELLGLQGVGLH